MIQGKFRKRDRKRLRERLLHVRDVARANEEEKQKQGRTGKFTSEGYENAVDY